MKSTKAAEFVEENLKTIFAYALSRVSNKTDAEDLTNDIVLAILQNEEKIQNPDAFYGYVWGIAANTYKKFLRKRSRSQYSEIDENTLDETDFTEELMAKEEIRLLRREIALLSREYRECTIDYYFDGLSCAEISKKRKISLEMVKYYLFKTRKILKEGICMEREFGEKSFRPAPFEFVTIFSGENNPEYHNLFSRKLPGQILMAAYYTPMTVRELAVELGVASVYLEDELTVLEKYGLLRKAESGKVQTNLVIFTEEFVNEFYKTAEKFLIPEMGEVFSSVKEKLHKIRKINPVCEKLSDIRLLWGVLWPLMFAGDDQFKVKYPQYQAREEIYKGAAGTNYGMANANPIEVYEAGSFAGYIRIDENYYASAADFGILPEKNRFFISQDRKALGEKIQKMASGEIVPEFMIVSQTERKQLLEILSEEISMMAEIYEKLFVCACKLMQMHAPRNVQESVERIVFQTLYFRTVGLLGYCAVKSEELTIPDFEGPVAVTICENTKEKEAAVNTNVQI